MLKNGPARALQTQCLLSVLKMMIPAIRGLPDVRRTSARTRQGAVKQRDGANVPASQRWEVEAQALADARISTTSTAQCMTLRWAARSNCGCSLTVARRCIGEGDAALSKEKTTAITLNYGPW